MIPSVVVFKWKPPPSYPLKFESTDVNRLYFAIRKYYPKLERFICITDDSRGLDSGIESVPLGDAFSTLKNPTWPSGPGCHRKLVTFAREFGVIAGPRFAVMDIDMCPVADLSPILDRTEDFVGWKPSRNGKPDGQPFAGALLMMNAGAREDVWLRFSKDPIAAIDAARGAGKRGSDQAIISHFLNGKEAFWYERDGVYFYRFMCPELRGIRNRGLGYGSPGACPLPKDARLIAFSHGLHPGSPETKLMSPWVKEHYFG